MIGSFRTHDSFVWHFLKAVPLSALLFLGVLAYFLSLGTETKMEEPPAMSADQSAVELIDRETATLRCQQGDNGQVRSRADCEQPAQAPSQRARGQGIVYGIYVAQWVCLNAQFALFFMSRGRYRELGEAYAHLSDWAVNAGPMLGVLGTIVAFAFLLADSGADGLAALFNVYFFNAAITTIMGGTVYIVCLLLTVWIGPAIKQ